MKAFLRNVNLAAVVVACVAIFSPSMAKAGGYLLKERDGVFNVYGEHLNAVAGVEMEIAYDPDALTYDSVSRGDVVPSGAQFIPTNTESGVVRIVLVSVGKPMREKGSLAKIIFRVKRQAAPLPVLTYNAIRSDMTPDPPVGAENPTPAAGADIAKASGGHSRAAEPEDGEPIQDEPLQPEPELDDEPPPPAYLPPVRPPEPSRPVSQARQEPTVTGTTVIERFRTFTGTRSVGSFISLFNVQIAPNVTQDPSVAISDGVSAVTLTAKLATKENVTPTFALQGARLSALRRSDDGAWVLNVVPTKGRLDSVVSALVDPGVVEIPLTVAPPVPPAIVRDFPLTPEGFQLFIADSTVKADVNGDGKRDFVDDFIFSANYVATQNKPPHQ